MDVHTVEQRSKNMRAIKSKNTKMEVKLAKKLWKRGHRFRRNSKSISGKPDFSLKKYKLAIFIDGEYFHGKDWDENKHRIKTNRDFWWKKIEGNIQRDNRVNTELEEEGWKVIRFWSNEIRKKLDICVGLIEKEIDILKNDKNPD